MHAFDQFVNALSARYDSGEASSIGRIVWEDVLHTRQYLNFVPNQADSDQLIQIQARLLAGEPLQYILGQADFFGLKFRVDPNVLIPRQETEELVDAALNWLKNHSTASVIDIGTGSGCIALTVKKNNPSCSVTALDVSAPALNLARENAQKLGVEAELLCADIRDNQQWPQGVYDLILSNPPYIDRSEADLMPEHVCAHEPALALFVDDGVDPLFFYHIIANFAQHKLSPGGCVMVEINQFRGPETATVFRNAGFAQVNIHSDLSGADRIIIASNFQP